MNAPKHRRPVALVRDRLAVALLASGVFGSLAEARTPSDTLPTIATLSRSESNLVATHPDITFDTMSRDPLLAPAQDLSRQEIVGPDGAQGDFFGWAVSVDGDTAVVGAYAATINGNEQQGAAYVFTRTNGIWNESAKLVADDGVAFDIFGSAVAISDSLVVVGAYQANRSAGAVYVFSGSGSHWTQKAKLVADNGARQDCLGWSLAISHGTVLAGAPFAFVGGTQVGAAYVFAQNGGAWTQTQELSAADAMRGDMFGNAVAIDGTTAVVGNDAATIGDNPSQGAAYVFDGTSGTWTQQAKLVADDGVAFDNFGRSVAVSGANVLVGAPYATIGENAFEGAVYAYKGPPQWQQLQKLTASDGVANGFYGWSLSMSGTNAMVGATSYNDSDQGEAYALSAGNGGWTETQALMPDDDTLDFFGVSVSVSGTTSFVGEPFATVGENVGQGAAFVYGPATDAIFADGFDGSP